MMLSRASKGPGVHVSVLMKASGGQRCQEHPVCLTFQPKPFNLLLNSQNHKSPKPSVHVHHTHTLNH